MSNDLISRSHFDERVRLAAGPDADEEFPADFLDGVKTVLYMLSTEPAVPHEMTAREYHNIAKRMLNTDLRAFNLWWDMMRWLDGDKALAFAEKWAKDHPEGKTDHPKKRKTYAEDFFEKFPKANRICEANICLDNARPAVCRADIYRVGNCDGYFTGDCQACWNEEMEEQDE